jgi:mannose-6-phosphate isomerase-like protein (cupin superfamily)
MKDIPAILFRKDSFKKDPNLSIGMRGGRKLLVTSIYEKTEYQCNLDLWNPPIYIEKCPVLQMKDTEVSFFNQYAKQEKHCHKVGTEMYFLIEGELEINVEGKSYLLWPGDLIVVLPNSIHEVKPKSEFLCMVVTVNCLGADDKYSV